MKKSILLCIIMLAATFSVAQIHFTYNVIRPNCGETNGKVKITVTDTITPYTFHWSNGNADSLAEDLAPGIYSVTITDSLGRDTLVYIPVQKTICPIAPELVFTPNGDGINDTWRIYNMEFYPAHHILVYNRWGQKVFEQKGDYEPWDGRDLLGQPVPDNSYYYIIYGEEGKENTIFRGSVSIIR